MPPKSANATKNRDVPGAKNSKIEQLLDILDTAIRSPDKGDARSTVRHQCRLRLSIDVMQPGGSQATHKIFTRNLSANGMAFLHVGYLHQGTMCNMQLVTVDNAWQDVIGTVVRCRHVGGRIHEVGIAFAEPLDLDQFISVKLSGTVLLIDDAPDFTALTSHHLTKGGLKVVVANHGVRALKHVAEENFDLILMDIDMPGLDGITLARTMRDRGVSIPIIVLTATDSEEMRKACEDADCDAFLTKPIDRQQLIDVIQHYLKPSEQFTSKYADNPEMADFISEFVAGLPARIKQMQEYLEAENAEKLLSEVKQLKVIASSSGGCGFDTISDAAGAVEEALEGNSELDAAVIAMVELAELAHRVKSTSPNA